MAQRQPLSRSEIVGLCTEQLGNGRPLPRWAANVLGESNGRDLVSSLESLADRIVRDSGALSAAPPAVRLIALAEYLGATIELTQHEAEPVYTPQLRNCVARAGSLACAADQHWVIRAGTRDVATARETVAHELAHALLYRRRGNVDVDAWLHSSWSEFEEAVCDYLARVLLIPTTTLPAPCRQVNAAELIASKLVGQYAVTFRFAALSWLDELTRRGDRVVAALFWRQYHPLDDKYLSRVLEGGGSLATAIRGFCAHLRAAYPGISYADARSVLCSLFDESLRLDALCAPDDMCQQLRSEYNTITAMVRTMHDSLPVSAAPCLKGKSCECGLRPEWVIWPNRGRDDFVPMRRGTFRSGSMAERLACQGGTVAEIGQEQVHIGDLMGDFCVHGFAHGKASQGSRFVLQLLFQNSGDLAVSAP